MANMIYGMLNVAQTALLTQQKALDITANNIANVNTEGYSRQRLNMEQNEPVRYEGGTLSTGVRANRTIQRIYDRFLAAQMEAAASQEGRWQAQQETLEKAELMFDDASGYGLNGAMNEFWNSWQELANNPSGYTERAALLANSENLTLVFNKLSRDLTQVQSDSDASIKGAVDDINTLTGEIAELNLKIAEVEAGNEHSANDFRDQRDMKLKTLSGLIDVNSFEDADGFLTVVSTNGHTLVDRTSSWDLTTGTNADGFEDVFWESSSGTLDNITDDISTGKLKGWIESRDTIIPDYLTRLDDMAVAMATAVNSQHNSGLDLNGDAGLDFFSPFTGAADITVNGAIAGDTNLIAAAMNGPTVFENPPGGNSNAIAMAEIQNQLLMSGNSATIDDSYSGLVSDVGRLVSQASVNADHQSTVSLQLATYREEVSGVSMDEEMVNMVQFQSAYTAAAKLVSAVDEMLQTLVAMV
ncbi:flagellar hook-associated protein 1 [Desulfosarcina alkanivorans]|uniref:Flagellar hook-associated protein 1 n=1 Tax=Desulfosarcina alkanivorans TaxID=571177 RepID=A0A5K7YQ98_9BACT|nr:flagellar hook-associated protein FlgK [Desulfosarcina alkanivorans]BBO66787.1 flagellar hook-associated protein 1 [Desulfosarcina alkanivorans]